MTLKAQLEKGGKINPFWICGPCVLEDNENHLRIAEHLKKIALKHQIPMVFKASFDKANRTSIEGKRGIGLEEGLKKLEVIKKEFDLPVLTDIHEAHQAQTVASIVDILQIPAFLCRQTDLLKAASETKKPLNIKKGQFLSPENVKDIKEKLNFFECKDIWITERGFCFGYNRLVVDFSAFPLMQRHVDLIMDITHSVQLMGGLSGMSGGNKEAIPYLAVASAAVGVNGFFAEVHPEPDKSWSDKATIYPLKDIEELIIRVKKISEVSHAV